MSVVDNLVTDRTDYDAQRVKALMAKGWRSLTEDERAEWLAGMKGAYNAADLNRVGEATNYLSALLQQLPDDITAYLAANGVAPDKVFTIPYTPEEYAVTQKTDWDYSDVPTPEEMAEYLANVALLRTAMDYETDALPETMDKLDYSGANAIEKALALLYRRIEEWTAEMKGLIDVTAQGWYYSGDLYAGEL